jgi:ABC-type phosphate/phosphonate transport system substrate-binding protein
MALLTYSNGLKEVGACLGSSWSDPDASGTQSIVWRVRWEATRDEQWKQKLMTYNLEDGAVLKRVTWHDRRAGFVRQVPFPVDGTMPATPFRACFCLQVGVAGI